MNLLNMGIKTRTMQVEDQTSRDEGVVNAQEEFNKHFSLLMQHIGLNDTLHGIESAVNWLRSAEVEAAYRIGLADGMVTVGLFNMQLQQDVNKLASGGEI